MEKSEPMKLKFDFLNFDAESSMNLCVYILMGKGEPTKSKFDILYVNAELLMNLCIYILMLKKCTYKIKI